MSSIGIIANPASGKDIRRIISSGSVFTNQEKINIIIRMLNAMDTLKVDHVWIMPDQSQIGSKVIDEVELEHTQVDLVPLDYLLGTWKDTYRTVEKMREMNVDLIIVMGGDGTSRIVAKNCQDTPMISLSTGTNNVFPEMIEGTLAGMAAAAVATGLVSKQEAAHQVPQLELIHDEKVVDIALIDLVIVDEHDIAARAVWNEATIKEVYLTRARPADIGLSSIGGCFAPLDEQSGQALHMTLGEGGEPVVAPIAPGLLKKLFVTSHQKFNQRQDISITHRPAIVALDGEREVRINKDDGMKVRFNPEGPWVFNIQHTLAIASEKGVWRNTHIHQ